MIKIKKCPLCEHRLYNRNEGLACKNHKCKLYFKCGVGWCYIGINTLAHDIINELWNKNTHLIFTKQWAEKKAEILKRDDYKCSLCNYKLIKDFYRKVGLDVHHIVPASKESALYLDSDNLITVCKNCHNTLHSADKHKFKRT